MRCHRCLHVRDAVKTARKFNEAKKVPVCASCASELSRTTDAILVFEPIVDKRAALGVAP